MKSVKQFLVQYFDDRKREGFVMKQDPHFYFYDALCVGHEGGAPPVAETSIPPQTGIGLVFFLECTYIRLVYKFLIYCFHIKFRENTLINLAYIFYSRRQYADESSCQ